MVDLDRDLLAGERSMWARLQEWLNTHPPDRQVPLTELGRRAGLHEERARQIARTWENDGLVRLPDSDANVGYLTTAGLQHEMPDE